MADEPIGSVSVAITGDYSALEKSFTASQQLAQQAGQQIGAAMERGAAGANNLTISVESLAAKSGLAGDELISFTKLLDSMANQGMSASAALGQISQMGEYFSASITNAAQALLQETAAAAGAVTANEAAGDSFKRVRTDAEAFAKAWDEAIKENVKRNNAEFEKFADGVQNFISHPLQFAGQAVKDFLLTIGPMGAVALGAAAALAVVAKETFNLVQEFGHAAEVTGNMADRLNLTWRETRNLEEMAQIAGVSITGLERASVRMAEALEGTSEAGKKTAEALRAIGVEGTTSGELLTGFLQKLAQIPNDSQRIALAFEVMGKGAQQMLPLIKNFGDLQKSIAELGPAIGDQLAGNLQKSDDALDKLNISWNRFKESIAAQVAPAVGALVDQFRMLIVETSKLTQEVISDSKALATLIPDGLLSGLGEFAKAILLLQSYGNPFTLAIRAWIEALKDFHLIVGQLTGTINKEALISLDKMDDLVRKANVFLHAATTGTKIFIDAFRNAGGGVAAAIDNIIASQSKLAGNVRDAKGAYDQLVEAFKTGTTVANGHKVTVDDVARALANLKAAEAAAATTKVDHTEKTKAMSAALREQSPLITDFIARYKEISKGVKDWEQATGQLVTRQQYLDAEFDKAWEGLLRYYGGARDIFGVWTRMVDGPLPNLMAGVKELTPLMDELAAETLKAAQAALDVDPYVKLAKALDDLGIKGHQYYQDLADKADKAYQVVLDSGIATYEELAQAALTAAAAEFRAALEVGQITREEADKTLKQIQDDLNTLDASHTTSAQHRGRTERTLGEDIQSINKRTFDSLERGLASSIVHIKGFGDLWKTLWQGLAQDLLQIMFKTLLDPLEKQIAIVLKKIPGLGGSGGSTPGVPGTPSVPGVPDVGGAAGAAGSAVSGWIGAISGAVTAISSVVGNFQMAGMNKSLDLIENYTRYLKIGLVEQSDSLLNDSHVIRNTLTTFMAWNWDVATTYFQGISEKLDTIIGMGGIHGSTAVVAKMSSDAQASAAVGGGDVNVTVDLSGSHITGGMTDGQVTGIMNRAIRMSKLAGAFPAGRFPQ